MTSFKNRLSRVVSVVSFSQQLVHATLHYLVGIFTFGITFTFNVLQLGIKPSWVSNLAHWYSEPVLYPLSQAGQFLKGLLLHDISSWSNQRSHTQEKIILTLSEIILACFLSTFHQLITVKNWGLKSSLQQLGSFEPLMFSLLLWGPALSGMQSDTHIMGHERR